MAFDERLADRVRAALGRTRGLRELRMMGGLCFTLHGNMLGGVLNDDLVVRVGPDRHPALLARPGARPMDFTGRPLKGFLFVGPAGHRTGAGLKSWLRIALDHARSLPPKPRPPARSKRGGRRPGAVR